MATLKSSLFKLDTTRIAEELIGCYLAHGEGRNRTVGRIVETEAYLGKDDPASHSFRGPTRRNRAMFGPPGAAYIYLIYGMHYCFNVVTREEGVGEAVLIRALEPTEGIELMKERRNTPQVESLCNGPAKLTQAMGLNPEDDGTSLFTGPIRLLDRPHPGARKQPRGEIIQTTRIGISVAADLPLRFYDDSSRSVSKRIKQTA